jgi:hypothetical protein
MRLVPTSKSIVALSNPSTNSSTGSIVAMVVVCFVLWWWWSWWWRWFLRWWWFCRNVRECSRVLGVRRNCHTPSTPGRSRTIAVVEQCHKLILFSRVLCIFIKSILGSIAYEYFAIVTYILSCK